MLQNPPHWKPEVQSWDATHVRNKPPHPGRPPLPGCIAFSVHLTNGLRPSVSTSPGSICTPTLQRQAAPSVHSSLPRQMLHQGDLLPQVLSTLDPPQNEAMRLSPAPLREPRQHVPSPHPQTKPSLLQVKHHQLFHQMFPRHSFRCLHSLCCP